MPRFSPRLARLIAAALLLQWLAAFLPLQAVAAAPGGMLLHMEICTPEGLRSVAMPGDPAPERSAPDEKAPPCQVHCALMLAAAIAPPPAPLALPLRQAPAQAASRPAPQGPAERAEYHGFFRARAPPAA